MCNRRTNQGRNTKWKILLHSEEYLPTKLQKFQDYRNKLPLHSSTTIGLKFTKHFLNE